MKQGNNPRRSRGRGNNNQQRRNPRNQTFESNGPDVKVRGTAQQVLDKYMQLARDAQSGGDRVKAEAYLQFAEHYFRILNSFQDQDQPPRHDRFQNQPDTLDDEGQDDDAQVEDMSGAADAGSDDVAEAGDDNDNGDDGGQRDDVQERRPRRRQPRQPRVQKNEATLAAEAAAANEARRREQDADIAPELPGIKAVNA
ncbi:MAG: DUF4167 domain-containing protein [Alphaproteobacteria bacterium]|nr:DUF4167 domain-containing protein [Alphaproteobacteria bacterium]